MTEWSISTSTTWLLFLAAIACVWIFRRIQRGSTKRYPPGPPGQFLLGNLLDMPPEYAAMHFREWSKTYGPVMHLRVPGQSIVVIDKLQAAIDLLDKRSPIYSDRPTLRMLRDVIGWNWSTAMFSNTERLWRHRKALHQGLRADTQHYTLLQESEARRVLHNVLNKPEAFMEHCERWGRSLLSRLAYGYDPKPENDRRVWLNKELEQLIADVARPGAYLVDTFPFLRYVPSWFPGAGFKRKAIIWSKMVTELLETPFESVVQQMKEGHAAPSYVSLLLKDKQLSVAERDTIKQSAADIHIAGANSIYAAVQSLFLVLVLYPEVQRKAQKEIDSVIGSDRLPALSDQPNLPYVRHIVSEMLRWTHSVPLGLAHELQKDDYYNGMYIPAKSLVMANTWSMTRDENMYDDPEEFKPERFEKSGVQDPRGIVFGFGRRICPGINFADSSLFVVYANILAAFNVTNALGDDGKPVVPKVGYSGGFTCYPEAFSCTITPRSNTVRELIKEQRE